MDPTSILILTTGVFGFYMAWNIGANDVANAMGTSVGSRALSYWRAVVVAAIFELLGCLLVGSHVTSTIQSKILDVSWFEGREIDLALGMAGSLLAAGAWLNFATWRGWPDSTTHSIIGALGGCGIAIGGLKVIKWQTMGRIVASWIISPIAGGIMAYLMFLFILRAIIRRRDPRKALLQMVPPLVFVFFFVLSLGVLFKGLEVISVKTTPGQTLLIGCSVGLVGAIIARVYVKRIVGRGLRAHSRRRIERTFSVLQIITACYMAFAHGANDVANAVAPLSAVLTTLTQGVQALGQQVSPWILLLGASGIVTGLATYGYRVMATIGHNITSIQPSRGFAAEFGAATTVLLLSKLGMPVSTTHTIVGAVAAIGLLRGLQAVNMRVVRTVFLSWLITVPASGLMSALFYWILKWFWMLGK